MTLTAIIGMVLFGTYAMVMDNGRHVRDLVLKREADRVFWGLLDNDMAGLCRIDNERVLPPLSRAPITLSDSYYRRTGTERPDATEDRVLLSFATSSRLAEIPVSPLPGPVCVEYVLRDGDNGGKAFIRRERDFCGVEGDFPWTELVLVHDVHKLDIALYTSKTHFVTEWSSPVEAERFPEAVRFSLQRETDAEPTILVAPIFSRRPYEN